MKLELSTFNSSFKTHQMKAPGSKSEAIRYIIGAFLCEKTSFIKDVYLSEDVLHTIFSVKQLGGTVRIEKTNEFEANLMITGIKKDTKKDKATIDVGSSATLLRLLIPVSLLIYKEVMVKGNEDLWKRPLNEFEKFMTVKKEQDGYLFKDLNLEDDITIDGSISSQYASGFLIAQAYKVKNTSLTVTSLSSKEYFKMTIEVLKQFGIKIEKIENKVCINKSSFSKVNKTINGDYSQAAYFLVLSSFIDELEMTNLNQSNQADEKIIHLLKDMGAMIKKTNLGYKMQPSTLTWKSDLNIDEMIDLGPILIILASLISKNTLIKGTKRLAYKESNRLLSLKEELAKVGIEITVLENSCLIKDNYETKKPVTFDSHNDHRIAMALTVFSLIKKQSCVISHIECVNKSYPSFLKALDTLGLINKEMIKEE